MPTSTLPPEAFAERRITDCEVVLRGTYDGAYSVAIRVTEHGSSTTTMLLAETRLEIDRAALFTASTEGKYGAALSQQFFANPAIGEAWATLRAQARANQSDLRVRLWIGPGAEELHDLHWETLHDPHTTEPAPPLATHEGVYFSRFIESDSSAPTVIGEADLRAVLAVANPIGLRQYHLAELDTDGEIARALGALGPSDVTIIGEHDGALKRRASLLNIVNALRGEPSILYLVCHGTPLEQQLYLWLEDERGHVDRVSLDRFVAEIKALQRPPLLMILAHCAGAGTGDERTFMALGSQLVRAGVPAVVAMQGLVAKETIRALAPALFSELLRDGTLDRALAVARSELRDGEDWWKPVLFTRLKDNRLWLGPPRLSQPQPTSQTVFINRREELFLYQRLLSFTQTIRVLTVQDSQGMGKSQLLQQFKRLSIERQIPVSYIDLKKHKESSPLALVEEIYADLSDDPYRFEFPRYEKVHRPQLKRWSEAMGQVRAERADLIAAERLINADTVDELAQRSETTDERHILRLFLRDLIDACRQRPAVVLLDSFESASERLKLWITERMVEVMYRDRNAPPANCLIVVAGQRVPDFTSSLMYRELIHPLPGLSLWTTHDIIECLRAYSRPTDTETIQFFRRLVRQRTPIVNLMTIVSMLPSRDA